MGGAGVGVGKRAVAWTGGGTLGKARKGVRGFGVGRWIPGRALAPPLVLNRVISSCGMSL